MEDKAKRIVIVGGVAAGATAAARARRLDERAEITVVEKGPYVSFANCGLPYHISGAIEKRSKLLLQTPEGFLSRYRVNVRLRTEATGIDRARRVVLVRDSSVPDAPTEEIEYDALLLAQGGPPVVPNLPGADSDHVFTLWTIPDMDRIQKFIKERSPRSAVVVGGGFIGLEVAEAFVERGLSVSVVELTDHLMPPMDYSYGVRIAERFRAAGAAVVTGRSAKAIEPGKVLLDDGSELSADLVLLSVGVRPNTGLAKSAGLEIGASGALVVDEYLRTADPRIWAAGDMVEVVSKISGAKTRIPLAGPANRQGRIAATNFTAALAESDGAVPEIPPMRYRGAAGTSVVKIFDETAAMTGLSLAAARKAGFDAAEATILKADHASYYPGEQDLLLSLVYDRADGRLLGAQAYGKSGAEKRIDAAAVALQVRMTVEDLAELDFAYAPPYSSANDPLNMAAFVASNARSGYSPLAEPAEVVRDPASIKLIDVRTFGEYSRGHAAGAVNIPVDELRDRLDELPRSRSIALVSKGGFESHIALRILRNAGFADVRNVSGGWAALRLASGLAIEL
ncbi:MAG: CoA-disulfide reductase [Treponema sp. GWA1_62_8]|nr:MAG: CoA-disulfide reductase [Treponema sp. GWA1_62_8]